MKQPSRIISTAVINQPWSFLILAITSLVMPFFLGDQQYLTGAIVNAALFFAVRFLPYRSIWPMIFLPSLAVLSRGLLFGPLTKFLLIFLPFIWLGNSVLTWVFRKTYLSFGYGLGVLTASLAKSFLLFAFARLFFNYHLIPKLFLQTMGINQLITAILGGTIAVFFIRKIEHGKENAGS